MDELLIKNISFVNIALDDFFTINGEHKFSARKLVDAHASMWSRAKQAAKQGVSVIIIDDVNLSFAHIQPFLMIAEFYGYNITTIEPKPVQRFCVKLSTERNLHGVPKEHIMDMIEKYEEDVDFKIQMIVESVKL